MNTSKLLRKAGTLVIALFTSSIICSVGWTATYYVDATNGNGANTGLCESSPWKTIVKVNASEFNLRSGGKKIGPSSFGFGWDIAKPAYLCYWLL